MLRFCRLEGEEKLLVMESDGVEPLLTLRTIESVFFHHPKASVTFLRSSIGSTWGSLEEELETLQESGYNLEVVEEMPDPWLDMWAIHSPTILLKPVPSENNAQLKQDLTEELSSKNIKIVSKKSIFCKTEKHDIITNLNAIRINLNLKDIKKYKSSTSLCRHILNNYSILTNIII